MRKRVSNRSMNQHARRARPRLREGSLAGTEQDRDAAVGFPRHVDGYTRRYWSACSAICALRSRSLLLGFSTNSTSGTAAWAPVRSRRECAFASKQARCQAAFARSVQTTSSNGSASVSRASRRALHTESERPRPRPECRAQSEGRSRSADGLRDMARRALKIVPASSPTPWYSGTHWSWCTLTDPFVL